MEKEQLTIGERIQKQLKESNKSVAWLSRETGIPATTLRSAISRGSDNISIDRIYRISNALDITMDELTNGRVTFSDLVGKDAINDEVHFIFNIFDLCGYQFEQIDLKDGCAYIIYNGKNKTVLVDDEFHELIKGAKEAAAQYVRDALEKKE